MRIDRCEKQLQENLSKFVRFVSPPPVNPTDRCNGSAVQIETLNWNWKRFDRMYVRRPYAAIHFRRWQRVIYGRKHRWKQSTQTSNLYLKMCESLNRYQ